MSPKRGSRPWIPVAIPWDAAQLSAGGRRLKLVYWPGAGAFAQRADVRWEQYRLIVTLSRMQLAGSGQKLPGSTHCVELELSRDASGLILIDGATGERATAKEPTKKPFTRCEPIETREHHDV